MGKDDYYYMDDQLETVSVSFQLQKKWNLEKNVLSLYGKVSP